MRHQPTNLDFPPRFRQDAGMVVGCIRKRVAGGKLSRLAAIGDDDGSGSEGEGDYNLYYLQDRLYNVVALTDTAGEVKERTWYKPYGAPTNRRASDGDETTTSHFSNPYLFTARRLDEETGLYYYRARYYHADLGRFISRDPIGYLGSRWNLYEYVNSQPTFMRDPSGEACLVYYNCFYVSQQRLSWNTVRCNYRCTIDTTKGGKGGDPPGTRTVYVGGVNCRDPKIKGFYNTGEYDNEWDFVGKCDCNLTMKTEKAFDHWTNPFRDCSRSECKEQVKKNIKALKTTCKLIPPGPWKTACKLILATEKQVLNALCDQCKDP